MQCFLYERKAGAVTVIGTSSCPPTIVQHPRCKQGLFQLIDICTKYGFCEEVVYKLMEQANLNHTNAN